MSSGWVCQCGAPWFIGRHQAEMHRLNNSHWRGSPALLTPYRQWFRERMPNGNQGMVLVGDDGLIRTFNPRDRFDRGRVVPWEVKTFGASFDEPTRKAFGALLLEGVDAHLVVRLMAGNCPGPLHHYPVSRQVADDNGRGQPDIVPEQAVVASRIEVTVTTTAPDTFDVSEEELRDLILRLSRGGTP